MIDTVIFFLVWVFPVIVIGLMVWKAVAARTKE